MTVFYRINTWGISYKLSYFEEVSIQKSMTKRQVRHIEINVIFIIVKITEWSD